MSARGKYYGLPWEKRRTSAVRQSGPGPILPTHMDSLANGDVNAVRNFCSKGKIRTLMRDQFSTYTVNELQQALQQYNGGGTLPRGPKAKLIDALIKIMPHEPEYYLAFMQPFGREFVQLMRSLIKAGGIRRVVQHDTRAFDTLLPPVFPVVDLYEEKGFFVNVVPQEVALVLAKAGDAQWEQALATATNLDSAFALFGMLCDLRGIVPMAEAISEYVAQDGSERDALLNVLSTQGTWELRWNFERIDLEGMPAFACSSLTNMALSELEDLPFDKPIEDDDAIAEFAVEFLNAQDDIPPRPLTDELKAAGSVCDWLMSSQEAQDILDFLDERMPDDLLNAPYDIAGSMLALTIEDMQAGATGAEFAYMMEEVLRIHDDGEVSTLGILCQRFSLKVPLWNRNGWAVGESWGEGDTSHPHLSLVDGDGPATPAPAAAPAPANGTGPALRLIEDEDEDYDLDSDLFGDDFDFEEPDFEGMRKENDAYLDEFADWLEASGLKPQTINRHLSNTSFFLNEYLCDYEAAPMEDGMDYVGDFLGEFFIRKAMWSTPSTIRSTAASLKKFYKCMAELGYVPKKAIPVFNADIKAGLPEWCALCEQYNDPYAGNPFNPFV